MEEVDRVLAQIGADAIPGIRVFNKIDRLEEAPRIDRGEDGLVEAVWISAAKGQGLDLLCDAIAERLSCAVQRVRVQLPLAAGAARARLYAAGVVKSERSLDEVLELELDLPPEELAALLRVPGAKLVPADGDTLESPGNALPFSRMAITENWRAKQKSDGLE
jgi:GTP-binding protein HflX